MNKIFVISDERCGGTQFGNIFESLNYRRVDDPQTYNIKKKGNNDININNKINVVNDINYFLANFDYIKVCLISFTIDEYIKILKQVVDHKFKIIFLWRKNYLERALSKAIAMKTGTWSVYNKNKAWGGRFSVDMDNIDNNIKLNKSNISEIKKYLKSNKIKYYNLPFCELYGDQMNINQRYKKILHVFNYVDKNIKISKDTEEYIKDRLSPSRRINNKEVYSRITNINDVIKKYSNKENGFIKITSVII